MTKVIDESVEELAALEAFAGEDDGGHFTFKPIAGEKQLGLNHRGEPRIHKGAHFVPDRKGGGKLYASAKPGARLLARVRRGP